MKLQERRPAWLKTRFTASKDFFEVKSILKTYSLNTVCEEAICPNIGECFGNRTATFLILGRVCTRDCGFCAVKKGYPSQPDPDEPGRIAKVIRELGLKYVVITSVTRDDLSDGGAGHYAEVIREIKKTNPGCVVEVLIPDLGGSCEALKIVLDEEPDVLNHNLETVPRLYPRVRPMADYCRSLEVLKMAKTISPRIATKSGLILGLGEDIKEVRGVMYDLRDVGCDVLTMGQYLSPGRQSLPVERYYHPGEFDDLRLQAELLGFRHIESAPLVRSSYHASRFYVFSETD